MQAVHPESKDGELGPRLSQISEGSHIGQAPAGMKNF